MAHIWASSKGIRRAKEENIKLFTTLFSPFLGVLALLVVGFFSRERDWVCFRRFSLAGWRVGHIFGLQLDWTSNKSRQKTNLPTNQKGYDTFETTVEKLLARRSQIYPDYFCVIIF